MLALRSQGRRRATRGGHIDSDVLTEERPRRRGNLKDGGGSIPLRFRTCSVREPRQRETPETLQGIRVDWRVHATGVEWTHTRVQQGGTRSVASDDAVLQLRGPSGRVG